ncbi:MAG TPA: polysaccharide deacetylase [Elusimicrobia bacterium]|nr:polysaccharide deacetylase [Elusimicrobiota bacterium]
MRTVKIAAVVLCAAAAAGYGLLRLSKARTFQVFGDLVARVATEQKVAALTFDDAPFAADAEVLRLLARERVKATFYCVGANIEKDPAIAAAITAAGHELGNHTWSHKRMVFKTPVFVAREIERTDALIRASGYKGEITFRPPYGKKLLALPWYLSRRGVTSVTWDLEPDTYFPGDAARIEEYVLNGAVPGSIILLHPLCGEACAADRRALPGIIKGLKARGYSFVTVSQLLALRDTAR